MTRRQKLEELLVTDPEDSFLNYALALEVVKEDRQAGLKKLAEMNQRFPDHVPAYFRQGQILAEDGETDAAKQILQTGLQAAKRTGDDHAAAEIQELLFSLEG